MVRDTQTHQKEKKPQDNDIQKSANSDGSFKDESRRLFAELLGTLRSLWWQRKVTCINCTVHNKSLPGNICAASLACSIVPATSTRAAPWSNMTAMLVVARITSMTM